MAKAHVHFSNDYTIDTLLVGKGASEISHLPKVCQHASKVKQQDDTSKRYTYIYIICTLKNIYSIHTYSWLVNPPNVTPTQLRPYQPVVSLSKALLKPLFLEGVSNTYRLQAAYSATLACVNTLWSNFSFGRPGGFEKFCFLSKFQRNSPSKEGVDDHSQILGFVFVDPLADMKTFCWC